MLESPHPFTRILKSGLLALAGLSLLFRDTSLLEKNQFINVWLAGIGLFFWLVPARFQTMGKTLLSALLVFIPLALPALFDSDFIKPDHRTGFYFVYLGIATALLLLKENWAPLFSQLLALGTALAAGLSLLSYLFQVQYTEGRVFLNHMAPGTATGIILLSMLVLMMESRKGFMRTITSARKGGRLVRGLLPAAILVPSLLGLTRFWLVRSGYLNGRFGTAVFILCVIVLLLVAIWYAALLINRREAQRQRVSETLVQRDRELEAIFNNAPDAVVVVDATGNIIRWNPAAEQIFGWKAEEVLGSPLSNAIIPPQYREAHARGMERYLQTGKSSIMERTLEMQAWRKDLGLTEISLRISPYELDNQVHFVGFLRDISLQKAGERKKKIAEQQFSGLFESAPYATIITDKQGVIRFSNQQMGRLLGFSAIELVEQKIDLLLSIDFKQVVSGERTVMENRIRRKNGDYFPAELRFSPFHSEDGTLYSTVVLDITERKENEARLSAFNETLSQQVAEKAQQLKHSIERYKTFVEEAAEGILVYSPKEGRYTDANRKAADLLGYEVEELVRLRPEQVLPEGTPPLMDRLDEGKPLVIERTMIRKNGSEVEVETSAIKLSDGSYLAFLRDIGERKKSEQELRRLNGELRKLGNYLQEVREAERLHIAREIHDELGQQLTVLKMDLAWLHKHLGPAIQPQVNKKLDELNELVDKTVSTIRKISSELRPSLLDDIGLVAAMEWHLAEFGQRTGIAVRGEFPENDPPINDTVKTNLFRILQESLTNVARHSGARSAAVHFLHRPDRLELEISDNGRGFEAGAGDKNTLGLLGMKERAHMMGAAFEIWSSPGEGSRIRVCYRYENFDSR